MILDMLCALCAIGSYGVKGTKAPIIGRAETGDVSVCVTIPVRSYLDG